MLVVERKPDHVFFYDLEDPGFFSATIHQPEDSHGFEVSIGVADLGNGPVANFSYSAPTLLAAGQIVTSEYVLFLAVVETDDDQVLAADFWLDQLDGGVRWDAGDDDEEDDNGTDRITKLVAWLTAG